MTALRRVFYLVSYPVEARTISEYWRDVRQGARLALALWGGSDGTLFYGAGH